LRHARCPVRWSRSGERNGWFADSRTELAPTLVEIVGNDLESFGPEEQGVGRHRDRRDLRRQLEVDEDIRPGQKLSAGVVDVHFDVQRARCEVDRVGSMLGKMSVGVREMMTGLASRISSARTTKVYGRCRATLTIHILSRCRTARQSCSECLSRDVDPDGGRDRL
jgi:hypothetical protein